MGGDIDVLFATILCTTMTQEVDLGSKNFSVFLVYSTMSLHEGEAKKWYTNLNTE